MKEYPLDNSAIIHLATRKKWYSNSFRFSAVLTEEICPELLQQALDAVVPRFPTVAAGIRRDFFQYRIVPLRTAPPVLVDGEDAFLVCMSPSQMEKGAFKVLYSGSQLSVEFFHSLTDGYGAQVFLNTLLSEYLKRKYGIEISENPTVLETAELPRTEEVKDDFYTFAAKKGAPLKSRRSYQIPAFIDRSGQVMTTSLRYDTGELLRAAKRYNTSLTVLLTAVMAASVAEIQQKYIRKGRRCKAVRIMVPVNLRNLFPSETLRNFSLFALPGISAEHFGYSIEELIRVIERQIQIQSTPEYMAAVMATHTKADASPLMKIIPVFLKLFVLRIAQHLYGEPNSCISLSNLGQVLLSEEMVPYVESVEVFLTPRISSPYNCSVMSYGSRCSINFSRFCESAELELCFTRHLQKVLCY